jgi:hypothetical protein
MAMPAQKRGKGCRATASLTTAAHERTWPTIWSSRETMHLSGMDLATAAERLMEAELAVEDP